MSEAAVEQLAKIISDRPGGGNNGPGPFHRPAIQVRLHLDEGWFSLILIAVVVYSTIWSIQVAGWVNHLNILSWTTAIGLILGVIAAKQNRMPRSIVHTAAILIALLLAFWQTSAAFYDASTIGLLHGIQRWFLGILAGGNGEDDSIFLLFITALSFLLAYSSAWLVYRTRSPWLMIIANAVVLLINLSNLDSGFVIFLVVFLLASLLLVLRFNLYESVRRWRRQGLRYADDLGWDVMQAGAIISIAILIFSWFLPYGYTNPLASQIWNLNGNPIVELENTWNRIVSMDGGTNASNHGNFSDTLVLGGNPNLNHTVVFQVDSADPTQYLAALTYNTYDGYREWKNGLTSTDAIAANQSIPSESSYVHPVIEHITVVNPPGEQSQYLFGASQIGQSDQAANVVYDQDDGVLIALLQKNGKLVSGEHYTITSYVSSADVNTLRSVPMPANSPKFPSSYQGQYPATYYDPQTLAENTQLPKGLDPNIAILAKQITANAPTMYDKVMALETYLKTNYHYNVNISPPDGQELVSWFLFRSGHQGYCTYFASAMAIMARTLGIPARIAAGYTNGTADPKTGENVIDGTDAHTWTQVYFAGYGWVNFEPSAGFSDFARPIPGEFQPGSTSKVTTGNLKNLSGQRSKLGRGIEESNINIPQTTASARAAAVGEQIGYALGALILLALLGILFFSIWWRRLFRNYKVSRRIIARLCLLANWAGIDLRFSQTPYEYAHVLAVAAPTEAATIERLSDIYVRELWANPQSAEHPRRSGEIGEMERLWQRLQPRLFLYVLRHPSFLLALPVRVWHSYRHWRVQRKQIKMVKPTEAPDVPLDSEEV
jgi:transglutaminase-like putative cysteine protease